MCLLGIGPLGSLLKRTPSSRLAVLDSTAPALMTFAQPGCNLVSKMEEAVYKWLLMK